MDLCPIFHSKIKICLREVFSFLLFFLLPSWDHGGGESRQGMKEINNLVLD